MIAVNMIVFLEESYQGFSTLPLSKKLSEQQKLCTSRDLTTVTQEASHMESTSLRED